MAAVFELVSDKTETLELYKVFVETITATEQRRQAFGAFYTSLIAAGAALAGADEEIDFLWIAVIALGVSIVWFLTIQYFHRLASAKFAVVASMESELAIRPFELEWYHFKNKIGPNGDAVPRPLSRWTLKHFDQVVPVAVMAASVVYLTFRAYAALR